MSVELLNLEGYERAFENCQLFSVLARIYTKAGFTPTSAVQFTTGRLFKYYEQI